MTESGCIGILSPGMYTVDMRARANLSKGLSRVTDKPGAAIWMPT